MAKRQVNSTIYSQFVYRKIGAVGQAVYFYFSYCELSNCAGMYKFDLDKMASELDLDVGELIERVKELQDKDFVQWDEEHNIILVKDFTVENGYHVQFSNNAKSIVNTLKTYHYSPLSRMYFEEMLPRSGKPLKTYLENAGKDLGWS